VTNVNVSTPSDFSQSFSVRTQALPPGKSSQ
jgi:hypothetical protein